MTQDIKDHSIGQDRGRSVADLREDMTYLVDEIKALGAFVDYVPFREKPGKGLSVLDMICEINRQQVRYYQRMTGELNISHSMLEDISGDSDISTILGIIADNRRKFVNATDSLSETDWNTKIESGGFSIKDTLTVMVDTERLIFKKISGQIMTMKSFNGKIGSES